MVRNFFDMKNDQFMEFIHLKKMKKFKDFVTDRLDFFLI